MKAQDPNAPAMPDDDSGASSPTTIVELAVAWTLVGIPLAWGVWQVFRKSLDLFH